MPSSSLWCYDPERAYYKYENESTLHRIPISSPLGKQYSSITTGASRISFLETYGEKIAKETGGERIMSHETGSWLFFNVGQLEYRVCAGSKLGMKFKEEREGMGVKERGEWLEANAILIRLWPDRIVRQQSLETWSQAEARLT